MYNVNIDRVIGKNIEIYELLCNTESNADVKTQRLIDYIIS